MSLVSIVKSIGARLSGSASKRARLGPLGLDAEAFLARVEAAEAGDLNRIGGGSDDAVNAIIGRLQASRNSHVIGLIHRHRDPSERPYDWYFRELIGEHHLEDFHVALHNVPADARLDIVLHSIGGDFFAVQQIARAIKAHKGETTVFVPYYAQHEATLLALAADKLVMGPNAALSFVEPVDQRLDAVVQQKGARKIADFTLIRLHVQRNWAREVKAFINEVGGGARLAVELAGGRRSQWDPISPAAARQLGFRVEAGVPDDVFELIKTSRAAPVADRGVKTADRNLSVRRLSAHSAHVHEWRLRDIATAARWPAKNEASQTEPVAEAELCEGGVCLENCDIRIRPLIARLQASRGSRVLCVIHRPGMESSSVDTATAEDVLAALRATDPQTPLDIILHTPGGASYEGMQIARAIKAHKGRKTVFVPYFAMSAGTIISLAADEIAMAPHAALGPIDAQVFLPFLRMYVPTGAVLAVVAAKPKHRVHDELLERALECRRDIAQHHRNALELMAGTYAPAVANRIAHRLNDGELTHGYPLTLGAARALGVKVSDAMVPEAVAIVRAFRRPDFGQRSVLYC